MRVLALLLLAAALAAPAAAKCNMAGASQYPPNPNRALPWHTINLDADPKDRWTAVVKPMAAQIHKMVYQVIDLLPEAVGKEIMSRIDGHEDEILNAFPAPFGDEIRGIAAATGIDMAALILYNIAYEIEGGCTSMVVENKNGHIFHARNLDFGLFFGWDKSNHTWLLTEELRPLLFNARFVKGGQVVYNATQYAGFVGLLTGMKTGGFSISVDTRFDGTLYKGLIEFFKGNATLQFLAFTTRKIMEEEPDFASAVARMQHTPMVGPSYTIIGGNQPGQGAVVTRGYGNENFNLWTLENNLHNTDFYVIETNYDNWKRPPFFDNRRDPAEACLAQIGQENVEFDSLFNLLSAQPNLNLLTTYTTLMEVATGRFEAYLQQCKPPCTLW